MKVNNRHLKALKAIASQDETRWVINGVHFEPCKGGYLMVATDGRKFAVMFEETKEELPQAFTLAARDIDFLRARVLFLEISHSNGKITIDGWKPDYMPSVRCDAIEGDYPKWRQVIPTAAFEPFDFCFDGCVFQPFIDLTRAVCPASRAIYLRTHGDSLGQISVFNENPNFYGVLMPMRDGGGEKTIPKWLL